MCGNIGPWKHRSICGTISPPPFYPFEMQYCETRSCLDFRFGQHYWLVDVDMDCSKTENSYFELKAIVGGWEGNVVQGSCTGSRGAAAPYSSTNHIARCGFLNIYHFGTSTCTIEPIP